MKISGKINIGSLLHFGAGFPENDLAEKYAGGEPPLRSELFSADQMKQHGKTLAGLHQLSPGQVPDRLLTRLAENEGVLIGVRDLLAEAVKADLSRAQLVQPGQGFAVLLHLVGAEELRTQRWLTAGVLFRQVVFGEACPEMEQASDIDLAADLHPKSLS